MAHISIENLTVEFAIFGASARSLKNQLLSQAAGGRVMAGSRDVITVRAIDQLNLEINDGDRVGLVGHNGSGKTTLLRVLAGIYKPNGGAISIEGQVGALLDPTAGMDRESSGIENIYLRGYMMGMSRREIASKLDEIADFTELGDFLELPMRTYSAGMFRAARLRGLDRRASRHPADRRGDERRRRGVPEKGAAAHREPFRPHPDHHPGESFGRADLGILHPPGADGTRCRQERGVAPRLSARSNNGIGGIRCVR
jgi:ABC-type glutathione transport system ATPase component